MGKPVVHFELWSKDPEKLSAFYESVFDWEIQNIPEMNYRMVSPGNEDGIGGGIMTPDEGPWPGNMSLYIDVEDLDSYRKRIVEAGGKIIVEEMTVPGTGKFALFEDPDGRVLGIWKREES